VGSPGVTRRPVLHTVASAAKLPIVMLDDTHPEARRVQMERLARMSSVEKFAMVEELTAMTTFVSRQAIRETMPEASEQQVILRWIELVYGRDLAARVAPFAERLGRHGAQ